MRKKAMEGLVSSEYATFFCMTLTNMPFGIQLLFASCIQSGLIIEFLVVPLRGMIEQNPHQFCYLLVGKTLERFDKSLEIKYHNKYALY